MRTWIVAALLVVAGCGKEPEGGGSGGGVELGKISGGVAKAKSEPAEEGDDEDAKAGEGGRAGSNPFGAYDEAQRMTACVEAQMLLNASEMFQVMEGRAPKDVAELKAKGTISRVPDDPWGNEYAIESAGPKVTSAGPDEKMGTEDDIVVAAGVPDPC